MSDEAKKLHAKFFITANGARPVRDWLKQELTEEQRKAVGKHLQAVEYGWPMGMPKVRKLASQFWEVRVSFDEGIARVFFTVDGNEMVLLHGFVKKTQKTPKGELDTALRRLAQVRRI